MHFILHHTSASYHLYRPERLSDPPTYRTSLATPAFRTLTTASNPFSLSKVLAFIGESTRTQNNSSRILYDIGFDPSSVGAGYARRSRSRSMKFYKTFFSFLQDSV